MSTVNLYDVLNVQHDCDRNDLKNAYKKLVFEFHPDRPNGDAEMFELVTHAFNILSNPKSRAEYDHLFKLSKQSESDHFSLKKQAKLYKKAQKTDITKSKKGKEEQTNDFKKANVEMDRKRGYLRDTDDKAIGLKDANRMMSDLSLTREQDDIEYSHEKIFDDGRFDISRFNAAFDAMHRGPTDLIPHSGNPDAYNTIDGFASNFSSVDNYEDIYVDDDKAGYGTAFSTIDFDLRNSSRGKGKKLSKEDINSLQFAEYTKNHNYIDKDYESGIQKRLRERESQTDMYSDRNFKDFDSDPTCGGYGIFHDIGLGSSGKVGNLTWDNDKDINKQYEKLLKMRKYNN